MKVAARFALMLLYTATLSAQDHGSVFLDPHDTFTPYLMAAIQKKGVPVTITTDAKQAAYTITCHGNNSDGSLVQGILTGISGDYNSGAFDQVSMTVVDAKTKNVTFSYTCKKYNKYSGTDDRMATSVAECLAKHWKNSLK